jgi:hypothetical protein
MTATQPDSEIFLDVPTPVEYPKTGSQAEKLLWILDALQDIHEVAEDFEVHGVSHKIEEAYGALSQATIAAEQAEEDGVYENA